MMKAPSSFSRRLDQDQNICFIHTSSEDIFKTL